jgi:signal transduction histidine kinase/HAMP domain-containing protein
MTLSLRTKILVAILTAVIASDGIAIWLVHDRLRTGSRQEAERQGQARTEQVQALYREHTATLAAEGEAVSLYPAVIAAIGDGNAVPLLQWAGQVAMLQGKSVTVTDATGRVIARGHAPSLAGDDLSTRLPGLRLALTGQIASGAEAGDELGLALRGYAPVRRNGAVVGAVMIADPLDDHLLARLVGGGDQPPQVHVESATDGSVAHCTTITTASATCAFPLVSATSQPVATLALTVPLSDIAQASADTQRALWLVGALILAVGAAAAWLLANSLSRPLMRLTDAARHIATGAYDRPVHVRSGDEIGLLARTFDTMRQEVATTTGALRRERDVRDAVLESAGDGILMVAATGETVVANERWTGLLGDRGLDAAASLVHADSEGDGGTFAAVAAAWMADADQVRAADFERFGPYRRFRCYTAPVRDRDGATLGRIFVLRDVTQEREAERMRSALIATVSHELRSPLTAIAGYTDTLIQGGPWDDETRSELLEIIARSAATLASLVDNLLDAAKMEAGLLPLEREPVRVERVVQRLVASRRALAPAHTLRVETDASLPLVDADPLRVEQVLANLLDNAIKYSPAGGTVTLSLHTDADGMVAVSIRDSGIGIAPDHLPHLFERFYRVADNRSIKGVGLGLFICKHIIEAHSGRIWVTSEPGAGSTFTFTLPRLIGLDAGAVSPQAIIEAPHLIGERVI